MESAEKLYFAIGAIAMALGAVGIVLMGRSDDAEKQHHYVPALFVVLTAGVSYLAMTLGQGKVQVGDVNAVGGQMRTFYYARYLDWSITTPLLLLTVASVALPRLRARENLVAGLIGADLIMVITGLFAGLSTGVNVYIWYLVSCIAFLVVLGLLWTSLLQDANKQPAPWPAVYKRGTLVLSVLWIVYPILFIIGTEALGLISASTETLLFMIVDVTAKVGFGFLLLSGIKGASARTHEESVVPER